jgi:hypothetical protein
MNGSSETYSWVSRSHIGVPLLDLLLCKRGRGFGVKINLLDAPTLTDSMPFSARVTQSLRVDAGRNGSS